MKNLQLTTVIILAALGGWGVLTGSAWAWALGFVVWHGAGAGVFLVPLVGICLV